MGEEYVAYDEDEAARQDVLTHSLGQVKCSAYPNHRRLDHRPCPICGAAV